MALANKPLAYHQPSYYSQGSYYSQAYYQSYYQTYYQSYYQGSYSTTFTGSVRAEQSFSVTNQLSKGAGTFMIDHPLKPKTHLLYHSFVESPDAKNIYDGVATLNESGEAVITLPDYFEALNKDFRYQVKPISPAMPNLHIKTEVQNNQFVIGGGVPGGRVSWHITGIRHDPYIEANPIVPEVEKGPGELVPKGQYLFQGYGGSDKTTFRRVAEWVLSWF